MIEIHSPFGETFVLPIYRGIGRNYPHIWGINAVIPPYILIRESGFSNCTKGQIQDTLCGIVGIALNPNRALPDLQEHLLAMWEAKILCGPDNAGLYISPDGRVGLANRRLARRDLAFTGHMPISNVQGIVWLTYNGKIYNTHF